MEKSNELAVLILAAGSSSRLGRPKQLLKYKGETFLEIAIKNALTISTNVNVVLGFEHQLCQKKIEKLNVNSFINSDYKKGMGSSIAFGVSQIQNVNKIMIMLCDQPLIPLSHYTKMIQKSEQSKKLMICSHYQNRLAVPSIFPKKYFPLLKELKEDEGARDILKKSSLECIPLEDKYSIDIDTKNDYLQIIK